MIANLTAWFALHVLFAEVAETSLGPVRLYQPEWALFDWRAALLAGIAAALIFVLDWGVVHVLASCAAGGVLLMMAGGLL